MALLAGRSSGCVGQKESRFSSLMICYGTAGSLSIPIIPN
jgi:hypothetical protein